MTKIFAAAFSGAALALVLGTAAVVHAQTVATDVSPGNWAYSAVQDLAAKGLIEGYPPDGNFLGRRAVTRFEMAAIVDRVLAHWEDAAAGGASVSSRQPQLDETQKLIDEYKVELTVMGSQVSKAEDDIAQLQSQIGGLRGGLKSANGSIQANAQRITSVSKEADQAYSSSSSAKYTIGGYIQFRAVATSSASHADFPQGIAAKAGSYNGTYARGGSADSFEVRRARIRVAGAPTTNTNFAVQFDLSGAVSNSTTQLKTKEAWGSYTFGNGSNAYPTLTAGQFATPFGYILPGSTSALMTPERPLAFSENGTVGLFNSQDYDKGIKLTYGPGRVNLTYALINGSGQNSENVNSHFDSIYRVSYQTANKALNVGASYYDGLVYSTTPTSGPSKGDPDFPQPKKQLLGLDAQVALKNGISVNGEFVRGLYESRDYFDENLATLAAPTGADILEQDTYVKGNNVQGWYVMGGYTFHRANERPLTLGADYDIFQRSISAQSDPLNTYAVSSIPAHGDSSFDDINVGYGALYNLDRATRLRLWYTNPLDVAHAPGTPDPPKIGLYTAEIQVKF